MRKSDTSSLWIADLHSYYRFIAQIDEIWSISIFDNYPETPDEIIELLEEISVRETLIGGRVLKLCLRLVNYARSLSDKEPISITEVYGEIIGFRFLPGLFFDLYPDHELARTKRITENLDSHPLSTVKNFSKYIDLELDALKSNFISETNVKKFVPILLGLGLATAWSAVMAPFLDIDLLKNVTDWLLEYAGSLSDGLLQVCMWIVFVAGLVAIYWWVAVSLRTRIQQYRLARVNRVIQLYLLSHAGNKQDSA